MKALILADFGEQIGAYRAYRSLALKTALEEISVSCTYLLEEPGKFNLNDFYKSSIFSQIDSSQLFTYDILVVDLLNPIINFDISAIFKQKLSILYFDNSANQLPSTRFINNTPSFSDIPEENVLSEPDYYVLDPAFWDTHKHVIKETTENIFLCMDFDVDSIPYKTMLNSIRKYTDAKISFINKNELVKNLECDINLSRNDLDLLRLSGAKIFNLIKSFDVVICSEETYLLELIKFGIPTIIVPNKNNQNLLLSHFSKLGVILTSLPIGSQDFEMTFEDQMSSIISPECRDQLSNNASALIDGQGARRIASMLLKDVIKREIVFRLANLNDSPKILELSNEASVRQHSFNSNLIKQSDHEFWYRKLLESDSRLLFVAMKGDNILAQVRLDLSSTNRATISISVAGKARRWGIGKLIASNSIEYLRTKYSQIKFIDAFIKESNISSCRFFESLGFKIVDSDIRISDNSLRYEFTL